MHTLDQVVLQGLQSFSPGLLCLLAGRGRTSKYDMLWSRDSQEKSRLGFTSRNKVVGSEGDLRTGAESSTRVETEAKEHVDSRG